MPDDEDTDEQVVLSGPSTRATELRETIGKDVRRNHPPSDEAPSGEDTD